MTDRKPPPGKVGTPEAAKMLGVTQQTIRNLVNRRLDGGEGLQGDRVIEEDGTTRYWVDAQDLERERVMREDRRKVATGDDVEPESAVASAHVLRVKLSECEREVARLQGHLDSVEQERDRLWSFLEATLGNRPLPRT